MAKVKKQQPQKNQTGLMLIAAFIIVAIGIALFVSSASGGTSTLQKITPADYQSRFPANSAHLLLDVRTAEEFNSGHIPGAVNISVETLANRLNEVPRDKPVVVYCRSGNRSASAAQILASAGYTQVYDLGGIQTWQAQGFPVE